MAFKIKLSIRGSEPAVTRTVALDPCTDLSEAALVFITAFGWPGGRAHAFMRDDGDGGFEIVPPEQEESILVEDLAGTGAFLQYDMYLGWSIDLEFKGETDEEGPKVLAWKGERPSQLFAGAYDFNRVRKAAGDPSDPYRGQAEAWLGTVPPYDMDEVNRRLAEGKLALPFIRRLLQAARDGDPLRQTLSYTFSMLEPAAIEKRRFRCPACGAECDGRPNFDLPPSMIRNIERFPATIVCPKCRAETVLNVRNDGFRIGYHEEGSVRPQDQQLAIYDMLLRKDDARGPFEEARYQAELGLLYGRYDYLKDNSDAIAECMRRLNRDDPRYGETEVLCREALVLLAMMNGRDASPDFTGFKGARGAMAMMTVVYLGRPDVDPAAEMRKAMGMVDSDPMPDLADRCRAAALISFVAYNLDDGDALLWAASVLEDAASEAEECADSLESAYWWALCFLMEGVVCGMYGMGMFAAADRALKCVTGPFADCQCDEAPPAVRNIALFRRAMLFLSIGGDREQALEDLDRFVESAKSSEDSGIFTSRRLPYAIMLRAYYGAIEGEELSDERSIALQMTSELIHARRMSKSEANMTLSDYVRVFVGANYPYGRAREDFRKKGLITDKVRVADLGEFDIDEVWDNGTSWVL